MQNFTERKNLGLKNFKNDKYDDAINDFSYIIDNIKPQTDEDYIMLMTCLLNRCSCYTFTDKFDDAIKDANTVVDVYNNARPTEKQKEFTPEQTAADPLTLPLSLAYVHRGRVYEIHRMYLKALNDYAIATSLSIDGEGQKSMQNVFANLNMPRLEPKGAETRIFYTLIIHLLNEVNLLTAFTNLLTFLKQGDLKEEQIKTINDEGCCRLVIGIMQIYRDHELIVVTCLNTLHVLATLGCYDVFNGFIVYRYIGDVWKTNVNVIGEIIMIMSFAPLQLSSFMVKAQYIAFLQESLALELRPQEIDGALFILSRIIEEPSHIVEAGSQEVLNIIFERKNEACLALLTRLCSLKDICEKIKNEGIIDWILECLDEKEKTNKSSSACIILSSIFINRDPDSDGDKQFYIDLAKKCYEKMLPVVSNDHSDISYISNIFAMLASCASYAKEFITDSPLLRIAASIFSINIDDEGLAVNITSLMYSCCISGLVDDVKSVKGLPATIISALEKHYAIKELVERAVYILIAIDHNSKKAFLLSGIKDFPDSEILKQFIGTEVSQHEVISKVIS